MGQGIRARRRGFVTEGIVAVTGTQTKTWVELGVPNGVTKLTAFLVGGGGGAGGGSGYANFKTGSNWCNDAGGGGSGYIKVQELNINALDTVTISIGSGGACGMPYSGDNEDGTSQQQTSGVGGGTTTLTYNNITYSASGGNASYNTPTGSTVGASNGANGGSGGGAGAYFRDRDDWEYEEAYEVYGGVPGSDGGGGGSSIRVEDRRYSTIYGGGSGAGVSTKPRGQANMECARGGSTYGSHSALGYGDGGYSSWATWSQRYANNGVVFLFWNNGGI